MRNIPIPANRERGAALVLALLMLSFLAIVGGALLTSVTLDAWVSLQYRGASQLQYMAEAAVEQGREVLRASSSTPSTLLAAAAGTDGALAPFSDAESLLASDDARLIHGDDGPRGRYDVFLRNDAADGFTNLADTNGVLTLVAIAVNGGSRKILEVTVMKERLPRLPAALTLNGSPAFFTPAHSSSFGIRGFDSSGSGDHGHAIGVIQTADRGTVLGAIPPGNEPQYAGLDSIAPPPADIAVVESGIDGRLRTVSGLERLARDVAAVATDVFTPDPGETTALGSIGTPTDFRVVVINGDCRAGPGTGFGLLLVRGVLSLADAFDWTGVVLVIGQGEARAISGSGRISGGLFIARTRNNDRGPGNPLGSLLSLRGAVTADFSGMDAGGVELNRLAENELGRFLPYMAIAVRER